MPRRDVQMVAGLRPQAVPAFLRALAPHFGLAAEHDLRLRFDDRGTLRSLYPLGKAEDDRLRARLSEAFVAAGRRGDEACSAPPQSLDIEGWPVLSEGVMAFLLGGIVTQDANAATTGEAGLDDEASYRLRAIIVEENSAGQETVASFAALVRHSRDARFMAGRGGVTVLDLDADPMRDASVEALRAAGLPVGTTLMEGETLGAVTLWLPEGRALADDMREVAATLLNGLADAELVERGGDLHLLPDGEGGGRVLILPPVAGDSAVPATPLGTEVEQLAPGIEGPVRADELGPAVNVTFVTLRPDAEAQNDLNERLNDRRFPMGYRVSLAPISATERGDAVIERLRAEIDEREQRIALLQTLGRSQLRLLRFSDAQLPALADGIRRMPASLRDRTGLLYAATHAATRAEPAHYILYDPETVQLDGILPEFYWRSVTEDHPIAFWLDPHAEEVRDGDAEEPMVFVPDGMRILPYIGSFGSTISGTLRLVLGSLFAEGALALDAPGTEPAFVFSGSADGASEIEVELLDLKQFAPLRASLRWINEHILARSPRVADSAALKELAETLYAGQLAQDLKSAAMAEVEGMQQDWKQAEVDLLGFLDSLVDAVTDRIGTIIGQMEDAREFAALARGRLAEVDQALNALGAATADVESELEAMAGEIPAMAPARVAFLERYQREAEQTEQMIGDMRKEAAALRERIDLLVQELRL